MTTTETQDTLSRGKDEISCSDLFSPQNSGAAVVAEMVIKNNIVLTDIVRAGWMMVEVAKGSSREDEGILS